MSEGPHFLDPKAPLAHQEYPVFKVLKDQKVLREIPVRTGVRAMLVLIMWARPVTLAQMVTMVQAVLPVHVVLPVLGGTPVQKETTMSVGRVSLVMLDPRDLMEIPGLESQETMA